MSSGSCSSRFSIPTRFDFSTSTAQTPALLHRDQAFSIPRQDEQVAIGSMGEFPCFEDVPKNGSIGHMPWTVDVLGTLVACRTRYC
jgi:hypothetical protein